jgi:transcription initiation factor TFIID subunit 7
VHKEAEVASTGNSLIRKRFKDAPKKLRADLEVKMGQKDEMIEIARLRKAGHIIEEAPLRAFKVRI